MESPALRDPGTAAKRPAVRDESATATGVDDDAVRRAVISVRAAVK
jgi:hypothetical protein